MAAFAEWKFLSFKRNHSKSWIFDTLGILQIYHQRLLDRKYFHEVVFKALESVVNMEVLEIAHGHVLSQIDCQNII